MTMSFYNYHFVSHIEEHSLGKNRNGELIYTVLFLPTAVREKLPLAEFPRLRVDGEMHNVPFEAALHPAKGRWYLLCSRKFMEAYDLEIGNSVEVRFNIGDQDYVDIPVELQNALSGNEAARQKWLAFTPGRQRGYAAHVASAKRPQTRESRAEKMVGYILANKNAGGRPF